MEEIKKSVILNIYKAEEDCIKEVLRQLLKRDLTIEDAKLCNRGFDDTKPNQYQLAYDGVPLGVIKYNYPNISINEPTNYTGSVEFIPH
jgi:hypothetical protein